VALLTASAFEFHRHCHHGWLDHGFIPLCMCVTLQPLTQGCMEFSCPLTDGVSLGQYLPLANLVSLVMTILSNVTTIKTDEAPW